jgi:hypothetical protein
MPLLLPGNRGWQADTQQGVSLTPLYYRGFSVMISYYMRCRFDVIVTTKKYFFSAEELGRANMSCEF